MSLRKMYWKKSELEKEANSEQDEQIKEYLQMEVQRMNEKIITEKVYNQIRLGAMMIISSLILGILTIYYLV